MGETDLMGAAEMLRSGECQLCPNLRAERAGTGDTRRRGQEWLQLSTTPISVLLSVTTLHHSCFVIQSLAP